MKLEELSAHQLTKKIVLISFIYFFTFLLMPRIVVPQGRVEIILIFLHCRKASHFTVAQYPVS